MSVRDEELIDQGKSALRAAEPPCSEQLGDMRMEIFGLGTRPVSLASRITALDDAIGSVGGWSTYDQVPSEATGWRVAPMHNDEPRRYRTNCQFVGKNVSSNVVAYDSAPEPTVAISVLTASPEQARTVGRSCQLGGEPLSVRSEFLGWAHYLGIPSLAYLAVPSRRSSKFLPLHMEQL